MEYNEALVILEMTMSELQEELEKTEFDHEYILRKAENIRDLAQIVMEQSPANGDFEEVSNSPITSEEVETFKALKATHGSRDITTEALARKVSELLSEDARDNRKVRTALQAFRDYCETMHDA